EAVVHQRALHAGIHHAALSAHADAALSGSSTGSPQYAALARADSGGAALEAARDLPGRSDHAYGGAHERVQRPDRAAQLGVELHARRLLVEALVSELFVVLALALQVLVGQRV